MLVDAIILTGGRSSRLDSVPKSEFVLENSTLLDRTLRAAASARRIVIVGHEPSTTLPDGVVLVREEPPFSGPVAAIAAGVGALGFAMGPHMDSVGSETHDDSALSDALLILACDMPHIGLAVPSILLALDEHPDSDGVVALDAENRRQPLAALYRTSSLLAALDAAADSSRQEGPLAGLAMFCLLDHMNLTELSLPSEATADVDTWDDAVRLGATPPATSMRKLNKGNHHG